jgi:hypothetical protein
MTAVTSPWRTNASANPRAKRALIGTDSPVSIEWSRGALLETIRLSATTSPAGEGVTILPLTGSAAGTIDHVPSQAGLFRCILQAWLR